MYSRVLAAMRAPVFLFGLALLIAAPATAQDLQAIIPSAPDAGSFAPVEAGRLYYETGGTGTRTIIFIHDGFSDSRVWDDIWPILGREYRVVRYDRRGFGRTPLATGPYSSLDDLAALMRHLNVQHAVLVAGSDGAGLALEFALAHPTQVEQLVLISPRVTGGPSTPATSARIAANNATAASGGTAAVAAAWVNDRYIVNGPNRSARARLRAIYDASPNDLTHTDTQERPRPPAVPRLGGVRAPTLIFYGARDMPDMLMSSQAVQQALPGARRDPVQGSGHLIYLDEPEIFAAAVLAFVRPWTP